MCLYLATMGFYLINHGETSAFGSSDNVTVSKSSVILIQLKFNYLLSSVTCFRAECSPRANGDQRGTW